MAQPLGDPKRLLTVLNRSALQRTDPPVYQTIKGLIDAASAMAAIPTVIPPQTQIMGLSGRAPIMPASTSDEFMREINRLKQALLLIALTAGLSQENLRAVRELLEEPTP